jgi:hypothetical protein
MKISIIGIAILEKSITEYLEKIVFKVRLCPISDEFNIINITSQVKIDEKGKK